MSQEMRCGICGVARPRFRGLMLDLDAHGKALGVLPVCNVCMAKENDDA